MRFPKMHVAQSTVNRIINTARLVGQPQRPSEPPVLPNTAAEGARLNEALQTPPAPAALPPGGEGAMAQAAIEGEDMVASATDAALNPIGR